MDSEFNIQSGFATVAKSSATRPHDAHKREITTASAAAPAARQESLDAKLLEQTRTAESERKNEDEAQQKSVERSQAEEAAREVSEFLNASKRGLEFSVDEKAGRTIVKVMDIKEEKVIRQIPTEEVLQLAQKVRELKEELSGKTGMLFESKV